jgi:type IV pilus assembly protein PilO
MKPFWRRRLLVPALVLLALNVGTYFAYTLPRSARERDVAARAVVLRQEVAEERARVEGLRQRARTIEANTTDVAQFYKDMGRKESLLKIQEDIIGVGRQLGLTIGNRSYSNETVKGSDSLARFRITMPISGSYRQVANFLQRIETLPHFVTVDSISLREEGAVGSRSTNLSVVLSVYFVDGEAVRGE